MTQMMRAALAASVLAGTAAAAPARADFFDDVRRTFQHDIPRTFQHDIPRAFGAEPRRPPPRPAQAQATPRRDNPKLPPEQRR